MFLTWTHDPPPAQYGHVVLKLEPQPEGKGPPTVQAQEMLEELGGLFELVQLREFRFDGVHIPGRKLHPLGWSALWRRRKK